MADIIFIAAFLILLIIPPLVFKLWAWVITMICFGILLGIIELVSKVQTGKTISNHFWTWAKKNNPDGTLPNKWKAWTILTCWQIAWWLLMVHLAWK